MMLKVLWVGPSGFNPELGLVETNEDKLIPEYLKEKYLNLGLIKEKIPDKKLKRNKNKED